ncbi:hypothetical protein GQ457_03G025250 [Hibiscus cannabinus]
MGKFTPLSISTTLILLVVLLTIEMNLVTVEGKTCESRSIKFKALICISNSDCDTYCKQEGAESGKCKGFLRKCKCTKPC